VCPRLSRASAGVAAGCSNKRRAEAVESCKFSSRPRLLGAVSELKIGSAMFISYDIESTHNICSEV
jgi:hypothetical protein